MEQKLTNPIPTVPKSKLLRNMETLWKVHKILGEEKTIALLKKIAPKAKEETIMRVLARIKPIKNEEPKEEIIELTQFEKLDDVKYIAPTNLPKSKHHEYSVDLL